MTSTRVNYHIDLDILRPYETEQILVVDKDFYQEEHTLYTRVVGVLRLTRPQKNKNKF